MKCQKAETLDYEIEMPNQPQWAKVCQRKYICVCAYVHVCECVHSLPN